MSFCEFLRSFCPAEPAPPAPPAPAPGDDGPLFPPGYGPTIYVTRETDLVTDDEVRAMCAAIDVQVGRDFAPAHNLAPARVEFSRLADRTTDDRVIAIVEDAGEGALGWHTEDAGDFVYGTVGAKPVLEHGGGVLEGALSVSSVLSHEVLELILNPSISGWADTGQGYLLAYEACDAVQGDAYVIDGVAVSNFVLPDYFSGVVTSGDRFDHLGVLEGPFSVAPGGYTLKMQGGQVTEVFGAVPPPAWLMHRKRTLPKARTRRLISSEPA